MKARGGLIFVGTAALVAVTACGGDGDDADWSGGARPDNGATPEPEGDTGSGEDVGADENSSDVSSGLRWEPVATGFDTPNDLADIDAGRLLISDQGGRLHLWADGELRSDPLLDISDRVIRPSSSTPEMGLSGFAVHPDFSDNGLVYVMYTAVPDDDADSGVRRVDVLSELMIPDFDAPGLGPVDMESERVLIAVDQAGGDHVGGHMAFDNEGLLYVGLGTSGPADEAQDPEDLSGTIVRIDVDERDGDRPYAIPDDNPFGDGGGAPEVFSYGFRNPFRVSWDDEIGLLVAEPMWVEKHQEVEVASRGGNHGYPLLLSELDAGACYDAGATAPADACVTGPDGESLVPPVLDYGPDFGQIVSGVARYTADTIPELTGKVIVADWRGSVMAATPAPDGEGWAAEPLDVTFAGDAFSPGDYLWTLDADHAGEVYALTTSGFTAGNGVVYRLTQ